MAKRPPEESPALQLVRLVWKSHHAKSWIGRNHVMQEALRLAVTSKIDFELPDIGAIYETMFGNRWFLADPEWIFSAAVKSGNVSACRSYEAWVGRKPFILEGKRLYVGAVIGATYLDPGEGNRAEVTSFGGDYLIACTYDWLTSKGERAYGQTALRRYRLTHEDIRAIEKKRKEAL